VYCDCGDECDDDCPDKPGHDYCYCEGDECCDDCDYLAPTCEEDGYRHYFCKDEACNGDGDWIEVIPALGHDWGEWEVFTEQMCCDEGLEVRYCNRECCDAVETRVIPGDECEAEFFGGGDEPTFDTGTSIDKGGNLVIDLDVFKGALLPQTNGQGWMEIRVNGKLISGNGDYNTNSHSITIKGKALSQGFLVIEAQALNPNDPNVSFVLELIYEGKTLVGTVWWWI